MFINKIGKHHLDYGENCQDFGKYEVITPEKYKGLARIYKSHKVVCDGCSEGKHSEVGAKLFVLRYKPDSIGGIEVALSQVLRAICAKDWYEALRDYPDIRVVNLDDSLIKDYCCFTILTVEEIVGNSSDISSYLNMFVVKYCGDGYIITQDYDDNIEFIKLDNGEYPKYLAYNYIKNKVFV